MKKIFLGIGTMVSVITPIAATIACGNSNKDNQKLTISILDYC